MEITKEQIEKLKGSYEANKEDLKEVRRYINKYDILDNGVSEVEETFEQGYNNALEYVFRVLGINI